MLVVLLLVMGLAVPVGGESATPVDGLVLLVVLVRRRHHVSRCAVAPPHRRRRRRRTIFSAIGVHDDVAARGDGPGQLVLLMLLSSRASVRLMFGDAIAGGEPLPDADAVEGRPGRGAGDAALRVRPGMLVQGPRHRCRCAGVVGVASVDRSLFGHRVGTADGMRSLLLHGKGTLLRRGVLEVVEGIVPLPLPLLLLPPSCAAGASTRGSRGGLEEVREVGLAVGGQGGTAAAEGGRPGRIGRAEQAGGGR
mmetsp:Transcript_18367/g.43543  ORF Transcript_18367/g.43543 Transcript_18367/m.43543 type:complete len:251 (-) Transcript_18367:1013-1765(-)